MTTSLPDDVQHLSWAARDWAWAPRLPIGLSLSARSPGRSGWGSSGRVSVRRNYAAEVHGAEPDNERDDLGVDPPERRQIRRSGWRCYRARATFCVSFCIHAPLNASRWCGRLNVRLIAPSSQLYQATTSRSNHAEAVRHQDSRVVGRPYRREEPSKHWQPKIVRHDASDLPNPPSLIRRLPELLDNGGGQQCCNDDRRDGSFGGWLGLLGHTALSRLPPRPATPIAAGWVTLPSRRSGRGGAFTGRRLGVFVRSPRVSIPCDCRARGWSALTIVAERMRHVAPGPVEYKIRSGSLVTGAPTPRLRGYLPGRLASSNRVDGQAHVRGAGRASWGASASGQMPSREVSS